MFYSSLPLNYSIPITYFSGLESKDDEAVEHVLLDCERYRIDRREIMQVILTKLWHNRNERLRKTCRRKEIDGGAIVTVKRENAKNRRGLNQGLGINGYSASLSMFPWFCAWWDEVSHRCVIPPLKSMSFSGWRRARVV